MENGLPSGTSWYISLGNGQAFYSSTSTISFTETNGTYSYSVYAQNRSYSPSPSSGSFTVNGASVKQNIAFSVVNYTVYFTESGLPKDYSWSLTFNGVQKSSSNTTIHFEASNGSYLYKVTSISGYSISPASGTITIDGRNVSQDISFTPLVISKYKITFTESGLPEGTTWYVNLSTGISSGAITGVSYSFYLPNGTYSYSVGKIHGYNVSQPSKSITVDGSGLSVNLTFVSVTTPPKSVSPTYLYAIIGSIVAVAAIASAFALLRRKK